MNLIKNKCIAMNNKITLGLTLTLMFTSSFSLASGGEITFSGRITEPTCKILNSTKAENLEVSRCEGSSTSDQAFMNISLSDINKIVNQHPSSALLLDRIDHMAKKLNINIDIANVESQKMDESNNNNYIIEFEYN